MSPLGQCDEIAFYKVSLYSDLIWLLQWKLESCRFKERDAVYSLLFKILP